MRIQADTNAQLRHYLRVIKGRKKTVILFFFTVFFATLALSLMQKNVYRGTVVLDIGKDTPNILEIKDIVAVGADGYIEYKDYFQTQKEIVSSRSILKKVYERLHLKDEPEFKQSPDPISTLREHILVQPVPDTRLLLIHAESTDPGFAAQLANTVAGVFVEHNIERIMSTSDSVRDWLAREYQDLKNKVYTADLALQEFKEKHNMVSLEDRQNIIVENLQSINRELTKAKTQRIAMETIYNNFMEDSNTDYLFSSQTDDAQTKSVLGDLKTKYIDLESKKLELSKKYKEKHPKMVTLKSEQEGLRERIKKELTQEYTIAKQKESALEKELEVQKQNSLQLSKLAIEYDALKSEAETTRKMLGIVQNRHKETSITGGIKTNNIFIHEYAEMSREHVRPKRALNMIFAVLFGLTGGIGLALLMDFLDVSIKSYEDVKETLALPLLGGIPPIGVQNEKISVVDKDTISFIKPQSMTAESYRSVRTAILYSSVSHEKRRVIVVTSPLSGEGKTTVSINLALVMAQNNSKILLIDADMRRPRIHKTFELDNKIGLSSVLAGVSDYEDAVHQTEYPNVSVMTSGPLPPTPSELLSSGRMEMLVDRAKEDFDHIIIDSPPILVVTDAAIISSYANGIVAVLCAGKTPKNVLPNLKQVLEPAQSPVFGLVINNLQTEENSLDKSRYYYDQYKLLRKSVLAKRAEIDREHNHRDIPGGVSAAGSP